MFTRIAQTDRYIIECSFAGSAALSFIHIFISAGVAALSAVFILNINQCDQCRGPGYEHLPDSFDVHGLRVSQPFPGGGRRGQGWVVATAVSQVGRVHLMVVVRGVAIV